MYWDASYQVTTPLFLGGADPKTNAELRPSSLKGLLRFWFRAIALPQLKELCEVQKLENIIFGSTKRQSSFSLTIREQEGLAEIKSEKGWHYGLRYLGYGVIDRNGETTRPYLKQGGRFTLRLQAKKNAPESAVSFLPLTLQALGLFGAAGARARKGFGSLSLEKLIFNGELIWKAPATVEELKECQKVLLQKVKLGESSNVLPEYTAFSGQSRVWIAGTGTDALELLNKIGYEMLCYRSYGSFNKKKNKHILPSGSTAEQNFAVDHDQMLNFCGGKQINTHPQRVVFGLPHNYYFMSTRENIDISPVNKDYNRRASPLFIHIHALDTNNYAAVLTLLPAVFLPENEKIRITASRKTASRRNAIINTVDIDCNVNYVYITDFMNRPAFRQSREVVWP